MELPSQSIERITTLAAKGDRCRIFSPRKNGCARGTVTFAS
jgi:hypothetical protein